MTLFLRSVKNWVVLALFSAAVAGFVGCGIKGPLEPPPDAKAADETKLAEIADPGKNSNAPPKLRVKSLVEFPPSWPFQHFPVKRMLRVR